MSLTSGCDKLNLVLDYARFGEKNYMCERRKKDFH